MFKSRRQSSQMICSFRKSWASLSWTIAALFICVSAALCYAQTGAALTRMSLDDLHVTNGVVTALRNGALAIDTPSSRAVVRTAPVSGADQAAEIRFRYVGPSKADKPLASGELRRQIGLKLRAADSCNVVYVMWHIAPDSRDRRVGQTQRRTQPCAMRRARLPIDRATAAVRPAADPHRRGAHAARRPSRQNSHCDGRWRAGVAGRAYQPAARRASGISHR